MSTFNIASERVKVFGYLDFTLNIVTIVVVGYGIILPYSPYGTVSAQDPKTPEILKPWTPLAFWLSVGCFGTVGLIGVLWSMVLVKTSRLEENRVKEKYKMLGYWLICNGFMAMILTYLWFWVISVGASAHEHFSGSVGMQIFYGFCYLFRIVLIFVVWRERKKFSGEREISDEDVDRWKTHVGYDREAKKKLGVGKLGVVPFYSRTLTTKSDPHENNI